MSVFKLHAHVTVSAYTNVEADSLEEAITQGAKRQVVIGGLHSGENPDDSWVIDEPDGEPVNITGTEE